MKFDLDHRDRGYIANLLRRRQSQLKALASSKAMSSNVRDFEIEGEYVEALADRFDSGDPDNGVKSQPIESDPKIVDTYIDQKK